SRTKRKIYVLVAEAAEQKFKTSFSGYEPWMAWAFLKCNLQKTNELISLILKLSEPSFSDYQSALVDLLLLKEKRAELVIRPKRFIVSNATDMLEFYDTLCNRDATRLYSHCNITIDCDVLLDFMKEGISGQQLFGSNTDKLYGLLQLLVKNKYDLSPINNYISEASTSIPSLDEINVERIYKVFDILNPIIKNVPSYTAYNSGLKTIPEYYASCIHEVKNSNPNVINACFSSSYDKDQLIPILSRYVTLSEMLSMALKLNNDVLYSMCRDLVEYNGVRLGDVYLYFKDTSKLSAILTDEPFNSLISQLDLVANTLTFVNIFGIDKYWINTINQTMITNHPIYQLIHKLWIDSLKVLTKDQWISNLNITDNKYSNIILTLDEAHLLPDDVYLSSELEQAVQTTLSDYVISGSSFDTQLYNRWKQHASKSTLAIIANTIKDNIKAPNNIPIDRFSLFIKLYITNSERMKDSTIADSFYDDFLSRYYRECPTDLLVQFTIEENEIISSYINLCSKDRQQKLCEQLQNLVSKVNEGVSAKAKLQAMIKGISPSDAE
ncbi:MAG: hypothetical protein PUD22_07620, partial [Erysipelotrichaceae bacterium]|nr:hypothetical protein [Erysipelotrichaceae bacterium]